MPKLLGLKSTGYKNYFVCCAYFPPAGCQKITQEVAAESLFSITSAILLLFENSKAEKKEND